MKKRVIVYVRVSTDDQANGYSPEDQEERLLKYCAFNDMEVVRIYHEDESAKDFENRPEWQNILSYIQKNKNAVDIILFAKWDRFSRNAAEAYITIRQLSKYNVEPQAMEQPLDFNIPESKIMLAVYLATPEVDNDRRALNTLNGMRKAKRNGRWIARALMGYKLSRDQQNKCIMIPEGGKTEQLVKKAFELYATGLYNIEELRRALNAEGLKVGRAQFWVMLRNKSYLGYVFVAAYKDEPATWVRGLHEALVSEKTFYEVQDALAGRKKSSPSKYVTQRKEFPLRGFLICPKCGSNLSGSASTGCKGAKFFYYHCSKGCKERRKANEINDLFLEILKAFKWDSKGIKLYAEILKKGNKQDRQQNKVELANIGGEIEKQRTRLKNAKALMLDGEFTTKEYKETKQEIEAVIEGLIRKQNQLSVTDDSFSEEVDFCVNLLANLDIIYDSADINVKQQIISSIFPEKMIFEENKCRTTKVEDAILSLCLKNNELENSEMKKHPLNEVLSVMVAPPRIELGFSV